MLVALEGFEPSQAEPESDVLPLHHKAISICRKANLNLFFEYLSNLCCLGLFPFCDCKVREVLSILQIFSDIFSLFFLTGPCTTFANGLYISKMKQYTHTKKCASASQHHISNLRNDKKPYKYGHINPCFQNQKNQGISISLCVCNDRRHTGLSFIYSTHLPRISTLTALSPVSQGWR